MPDFIYTTIIYVMEILGIILFFNTFMERQEKPANKLLKFGSYIVVTFLMAYTEQWIGLGKCILIILAWICLNKIWYRGSLRQNILFSIIGYTMLILMDYVMFCFYEVILPDVSREELLYNRQYGMTMKAAWIIVSVLIHKCCKKKMDYNRLTPKEWRELVSMPIFTLVALIWMFYTETEDIRIHNINLFLSIGLVAVNFIVINLMQNILEKEERIRVGMLADQSQKNLLLAYQDREEIYERQRKKMHDYKNQLSAIQTMLKGNKPEEALEFTQKLTESIAVDMSAVNTNHPVVNAVLNQKYRTMQGKHISLILKVDDLREFSMAEEDIIILLSNLLDNAIKASEKVQKKTGKAVVHLKLGFEENKLLLSVRNPVTEKVEIVDNEVQAVKKENHGIGLLNVREVVEKYGGDMVLSCDEKEFKVVVMV